MTKAGQPPALTAYITLFMMGTMQVLGYIRDFFGRYRGTVRQGYAPIQDAMNSFYRRRLYTRMVDCWNRPIASAPDAWFDVLERTSIEGGSGMHQGELELTGSKRHCLNLGSYNYLGFAASDVYCTPRVLNTLSDYGVSCCTTREAAGTTQVHAELEFLLSKYLGVQSTLTYGMGFATNSATIPALVGKGCLILSDALNHTSIVTGAKVSGAKVKVFRHNDARHLEAVLRQSIAEGQPRTGRAWRKILVIVEGVYSMEGELCDLAAIVEVKKRYNAYLYLDEAHSIGALGATGRGVCEHAGVDPDDVDIMMGTFTKSFGSCGGYIGGSKALIDHLRRNSPAHLYATAMAPAATQQVLSALKLLMGDDGTDRGQRKVAQLHDNANFFRTRLIDMGLDVLGDMDSPIMPIMLYHSGKIPAFSRACFDNNVAMVVVGPPATELLLPRARVCISAAHSRQDLEYALEVIQRVACKCLMNYRPVAPSMKPAPSGLLSLLPSFNQTAGPGTALITKLSAEQGGSPASSEVDVAISKPDQKRKAGGGAGKKAGGASMLGTGKGGAPSMQNRNAASRPKNGTALASMFAQ